MIGVNKSDFCTMLSFEFAKAYNADPDVQHIIAIFGTEEEIREQVEYHEKANEAKRKERLNNEKG